MPDMIDAFQSMTREDVNETISRLSICAGLMFSIALILLLLSGVRSVWGGKPIVVGAIVILCTVATVAGPCATVTLIGHSLTASIAKLTEEPRKRDPIDNEGRNASAPS